MKATEQTLQEIERCIRRTAEKIPANPDTSIMTDIHVRVIQDSGEVITYNDNDEEIARGVVEQWIDNTDDDYMPVDKLCLYATSKEEQKENELADPEDKLIQDFVITSDYEVRLTDYSGKFEAEVQRVYHVDPSRKFSEDAEIDYEQNASGADDIE